MSAFELPARELPFLLLLLLLYPCLAAGAKALKQRGVKMSLWSDRLSQKATLPLLVHGEKVVHVGRVITRSQIIQSADGQASLTTGQVWSLFLYRDERMGQGSASEGREDIWIFPWWFLPVKILNKTKTTTKKANSSERGANNTIYCLNCDLISIPSFCQLSQLLKQISLSCRAITNTFNQLTPILSMYVSWTIRLWNIASGIYGGVKHFSELFLV